MINLTENFKTKTLYKLYIHIIFHVKNERILILPEDERELYAYIGVRRHSRTAHRILQTSERKTERRKEKNQ